MIFKSDHREDFVTLRRAVLLAAAVVSVFTCQAATPKFFDRTDYATLADLTVATGDVNGDGIQDIVASGQGLVTAWLGNGDGTFREGPSETSLIKQYAFSEVLVDLNHDGKLDVIVAGQGSHVPAQSGITVWMGNGDGSFQSPVFYVTGSDLDAHHVVVADFNGDHILDMTVLSESGLWFFKGRGNGTFAAGAVVTSLPNPSGYGQFMLASGDLNGDGKLDLIAETGAEFANSGFQVLLGNGDGTFTAGAAYVPPTNAWTFAVADLNADGRPDVILSNLNSNWAYLYPGNGDGSFASPAKVYLPAAAWITVADVNGDGKPDLLSSSVLVAFGKGNGTFQYPILYPVGASPTPPQQPAQVIAARLRKNGPLDLVTANYGGSISILLNNGSGKFRDGLHVATPADGAGLVTADFNHDGKPDLALTDVSGVSIYMGTGKAAAPLTLVTTLPLTNAGNLLTADLNGDGKADLVAMTATATGGAVNVFLGDGAGGFSALPALTFATAYFNWGVLADFNRDGKLDLALAGNLLFLGNGDGTFQNPVPYGTFTPSETVELLTAGDINGDGAPDIIAPDFIHGIVYVLMNNGSGTFTQTSFSTAAACYAANFPSLADLNGDGKLDLALTCGDAKTAIYLGNGDGTFNQAASLPAPVFSEDDYGPIIADLDGDGIPDVAQVVGYTLAISHGNGDGTFQSPVLFGVGPFAYFPVAVNLHGQSPAAGLPDIVVPDGSGYLDVLLNVSQ